LLPIGDDMKMKCLGSGSSGNCYILENESEALIIEAGVSFKEVKIALGFNVKKIAGLIVSHEHGDHLGCIKDYANTGIPIYQPFNTEIDYADGVWLGRFYIQTFELIHSVPCFGFLIKHKEMGKLLFVTDTEYVKYRFKDLNHILIEANYSKELLNQADQDSPKRNHVLTGHMALDTTLEFLKVNQSANLRNLVLTHLSEHNADPNQFREEAEKVVNCPVYIAKKGLEIEIGLPF